MVLRGFVVVVKVRFAVASCGAAISLVACFECCGREERLWEGVLLCFVRLVLRG